jgi:hypothetical protein
MYDETSETRLYEAFYSAIERADIQASYLLARLLCAHFDDKSGLKKLDKLRNNTKEVTFLPISLNQLVYASRYLKNPSGLKLYIDRIHAYSIAELNSASQAVLEYLTTIVSDAMKGDEQTTIQESKGGSIGDTERLEHIRA